MLAKNLVEASAYILAPAGSMAIIASAEYTPSSVSSLVTLKRASVCPAFLHFSFDFSFDFTKQGQ